MRADGRWGSHFTRTRGHMPAALRPPRTAPGQRRRQRFARRPSPPRGTGQHSKSSIERSEGNQELQKTHVPETTHPPPSVGLGPPPPRSEMDKANQAVRVDFQACAAPTLTTKRRRESVCVCQRGSCLELCIKSPPLHLHAWRERHQPQPTVPPFHLCGSRGLGGTYSTFFLCV